MASNPTLASILGDQFKEDLQKLEKQFVLNVSDLKLLKKEHWKSLGLSKPAKKLLKAAAGIAKKDKPKVKASSPKLSPKLSPKHKPAQLPQEKSAAVLSSAVSVSGKNDPISAALKDKAQIRILESELIITLQDVEWLSEEDWNQLIAKGITHETKKLLEQACGQSGLYGAVQASELSQVLKESKFSTDLLILDSEMIYTLEDVFRLTKEDWNELFEKRFLVEAQKKLLAALPPRPIPHKGPYELKTKVGSILHEDYFFRDRRKCDEQMVFILQDVLRLDNNDWCILNLSAPAKAKLLQARATFEEELQKKGKKSKKSKKLKCAKKLKKFKKFKVLSGKNTKYKAALLKRRIKVLDRAIKCAHRVALRAEINAIRNADNLAKLKTKRKQLVKGFRS